MAELALAATEPEYEISLGSFDDTGMFAPPPKSWIVRCRGLRPSMGHRSQGTAKATSARETNETRDTRRAMSVRTIIVWGLLGVPSRSTESNRR